MFSSKNEEWETPPEIFIPLNEQYHFTLDVCATPENTKCPKYISKGENALIKDWGGEICFMNPPYGREIKKWIKKAYEEGQKPNTIVVCLIPARTDTSWWWDYVMKGHITFIRGRIKFINKTLSNYKEGEDNRSSAPFPSAIVVFTS